MNTDTKPKVDGEAVVRAAISVLTLAKSRAYLSGSTIGYDKGHVRQALNATNNAAAAGGNNAVAKLNGAERDALIRLLVDLDYL